MTATRTSRRLAVTSTIAIATALLIGKAPEARAQSFQGSGTVVAGSASIVTGPGTTGVTVSSNSVVIDWTPTDTAIGGGAINFQPAGTTATFTQDPMIQDSLSVLNRILPTDPTRAVQFNGTVISQIQQISGGPIANDGELYFYSPGGIVVGATSVFDVGVLGLTTSNIAYNPTTGSFILNETPTSGTVVFPTANPGTSVIIQPGALINAPGTNYIAIVAPVIQNSGTINVGRVAALVSADAATIDFSVDGLFNISVTEGTSGTGLTLFNDGSITGPLGSGLTDSNRIYMVAVPKNQAITMAIASGSTLGFDLAGAADVDGNVVVLSAGYNVVAGNVAGPAGGSGQAAISIGGGNVDVTSVLNANATGAINLSATTGVMNFAGDVNLTSPLSTTVQAIGANSVVNFGRDLLLDSTRVGAVGGNASMLADTGGLITVGRNTLVYATGFGASTSLASAPGAIAGTGQGGIASVRAGGSGTIDFTGRVSVFADGVGGNGAAPGTAGGAGIAGNVNLTADTGGTILIGTDIDFTAEGFGGNGNGCVSCLTDGGNATGGTANLVVNNGTIATGGYFRTSVRAVAGNGLAMPAGMAIGGSAVVNLSGATVSSGDFFLVDANARGGDHGAGGVAGAGFGGSIGFNGDGLTAPQLDLSATGAGGDSIAIGVGQGGVGSGGNIFASLGTISGGAISANVGGFGGAGNVSGGTGSGGSANLDAIGTVTADTVEVYAHGSGGEAAAAIGSLGGNAVGGTAGISATAGSLTVSGGVIADATGFGGAGATGGNANGGNAVLQTSGSGSITVNDFDFNVSVIADGQAGAANFAGGTGGNSQGGNAQIVATGGSIDISTLSVIVRAQGIEHFTRPAVAGTDGGNGRGGTASISQGGTGSISITADPITVSTLGVGTDNLGGGDGVAGTGTGGDSRIAVNSSGGISLTGQVTVEADGIGGNGAGINGISSGGAATGGLANIGAANGTNAISGGIVVTARALGGNAQQSGSGGQATGGQALVGVVNGATAGAITFGQALDNSLLSAEAIGGAAQGAGTGGNAVGGTAQIFASGGNVSTLGSVLLTAEASGGGSSDGLGGNGTGGFSNLLADGRTITIGGAALLSSNGAGGSATGTGNGGVATGGNAQVLAQNNGTVNLLSNVTIEALGFGGDGGDAFSGGNGGNGTGGLALVRVLSSGDITIDGTASLDAGGMGGDGDLNTGVRIGGDGLGGSASITAGDGPVNNAGGGSISLGSIIEVRSRGVGGESGQAGNGTGGNATVRAWNGSIATNTVSSLIIDANGLGGLGNAGGDGGDGLGGFTSLFSGSSLNGASSVTVDAVTITAIGQGGFGNRGLNPGDTGGLGGDGTGGRVFVTAGAGNGNLTVDVVDAQAGGFGGGGGDGGDNVSGLAGNGGTGGIGTGGVINVGVESATATPLSAGSANFGTVQISAQGAGGDGGNGGAGATQGNGGNGGAAFDGASILLVRGAPVTVTGLTSLFSGATGGNGGIGAVDGVGGDATVGGNGGIGVFVTSRFQAPTQRGTLTAADIIGTANAIGGTGSVSGNAISNNSPISFFISNGDATIDSVDLTSFADTVTAGSLPAEISITGGTATINGRFGLATDGDVTLKLDGGDLVADSAEIFARNWILGTAPVSAGTLRVTSGLNLGTFQDLVTFANLDAPFTVGFSVPGAFQFGNVSADGDFFASADGPITLGTLSATGNADLLSGANITTISATTGGYLNYESLGSVSTGAISAGEYIEVDSLGGAATTGNVQVGDYFTLQANGPVTVGNVTAGIVNPSTDPLATYNVGIAANGNLSLGTIQAAGDIGLLANTGSVTAGALTGRDILLLADAGVTINGPILASARLGIARSSLAALGGAFEEFDKDPVFAGLPAAIDQVSATTFGVAGPVSIGGTVTAQSLKAFSTGNVTTSGAVATTGGLEIAAGGNVSTGALSDGNRVVINSGGTLTTNGGTVTGGSVVMLSGGAISLGAISSNRAVTLSSQSDVTSGNINSADRLFIGSQGNISTGNIVSDPVLFNTGSLANNVQMGAGGSISTGSIRSTQNIALAAGQNITVGGQITSRFDVALLAGQSVSTGNILAGAIISPTGALTGANGRLLIGNPSMIQSGGAGTIFNLDYNALFSAEPARIGGTILLNGQIISAFTEAYSQGDITGFGVIGFNRIEVESGGLVSVRGIWGSPQIEIRSNDIDIAAPSTSPTNPTSGGSLRGIAQGLVPGEVDLVSLNQSPALIGDGLTGSGYSLSNAELGRIITGTLLIGAVNTSANLIDMLVGDLTIASAQAITSTTTTGASGQTITTIAGGTINGPDGRVIFVTGDPETSTVGGGIKVVGNVAGTNFAETSTVEFATTLLELDTATGSVKLAGANTALGGIIEVDAQHIHIADGAILTKLEADPFYVGYIADLNRPATVSRPDGVFNAAALDIFPGSTFYVQNTGTALTPAGFVTTEEVDVTPPDVLPTGGIEVVVNGQFVTATGTLTGVQAYNALIASEADFTGFSTQSQLNSCLFIGGCITAADPVASISSEIAMIASTSVSDPEVAAAETGGSSSGEQSDEDQAQEQQTEEEQAAEEAAEEDAAASPIAPPAPLIDTRPMNPPANVTEPVAGSGNPALIGSAIDEGIAQGDEK
jgi:hypothetical protein